MKVILSLFCFLIFNQVANAKTLTLNEVLVSSMKHYPEVLEGAFNLEEFENRYRQARGAGFDTKIKVDADKRFEGFYDGENYKAQIEKPISYLNSKIYAGYRKSDGTFPSYEGKLETLPNDGEAFMGFSLSLLRGAFIDLRRYNSQIAREDFNQSSFNLDQIKIKVQTAAVKAYWSWVVRSLEFEAFKEILELAKTRQGNISKRVKAGDLARIYEAENDLYINERVANLKKAQIQYEVASFYLSLFFRDELGEPMNIFKAWVPEVKMKDLETITFSKALLDRAVAKNLDLKILESKKTQAKAEMRLGHNDLLPKLDLKFEVGQDSGTGDSNFQETRGFLTFEVPLEFNKGLGKKRAGRAKFEAARTKAQLENDKIRVYLSSLLSKINNTKEVIDLTNNQVELSEKLAKAELRKFRQGSSDLLLLNIREEKLAQSKVKNLDALLMYQNYRAELKEVLVDFVVK